MIIFCTITVAIFVSIFGSPIFFSEPSREESDRQTDPASNKAEQAVHVHFGCIVNVIELPENGLRGWRSPVFGDGE